MEHRAGIGLWMIIPVAEAGSQQLFAEGLQDHLADVASTIGADIHDEPYLLMRGMKKGHANIPSLA